MKKRIVYYGDGTFCEHEGTKRQFNRMSVCFHTIVNGPMFFNKEKWLKYRAEHKEAYHPGMICEL